eukprot:scpid32599/ scgid16929/ 
MDLNTSTTSCTSPSSSHSISHTTTACGHHTRYQLDIVIVIIPTHMHTQTPTATGRALHARAELIASVCAYTRKVHDTHIMYARSIEYWLSTDLVSVRQSN